MRHSLHDLWEFACNERPPNPSGFAGELAAELAKCLEVEQIEYAALDEIALFLMDLSPLHLKGMDLNILMVTHAPTNPFEERLHANILAEQQDIIKTGGLCFQILLGKENPQKNNFIRSDLQLIQITYNSLERILASRAPQLVLYETIRKQVPIQKLCPYDTTREARGAMFFGRLRELELLTDDTQTCFLLSGARRIGKTSLLTRAHQKLSAKPMMKDRAFYVSCINWSDTRHALRSLAHLVSPKGELRIDKGPRNIAYILERLSKKGRQPFFIFFDEIDRIVDLDAGQGWPLFRILREATDNRWIRPVFAGYRSANTLVSDNSSPFYDRLRTLYLNSLRKTDAEDLIRKPFQSIGFTFYDYNSVIDRVWAGTAGQAFMLHFYGENLFQLMTERGSEIIRSEDIDSIERGQPLAFFLLDHFLDNTRSLLGQLSIERLCSFQYARSRDENWAEGDFIRNCSKIIQTIEIDSVHAALRNLVLAHILTFSDYRYSFTLPIMKRVLRSALPGLESLLKQP